MASSFKGYEYRQNVCLTTGLKIAGRKLKTLRSVPSVNGIESNPRTPGRYQQERVKLIGVGVIRYAGAASRLHLPVLSHLPGVRVTAIAGTTQEAILAVVDQYAVPARYPDYRDLLLNPAVDAVAICVPPDLHETRGHATHF